MAFSPSFHIPNTKKEAKNEAIRTRNFQLLASAFQTDGVRVADLSVNLEETDEAATKSSWRQAFRASELAGTLYVGYVSASIGGRSFEAVVDFRQVTGEVYDLAISAIHFKLELKRTVPADLTIGKKKGFLGFGRGHFIECDDAGLAARLNTQKPLIKVLANITSDTYTIGGSHFFTDTAFVVSADDDKSRVLVRTTLRDKRLSLGEKELGLAPLVTFVELLEPEL